MSDALRIRPFDPADVPAITKIYAHHVLNGASSWELTPPDEAEMRRRADGILAAGYPYLVAVDGDTVVGYAYASAYRPRPAYRFTVEHSIYVLDGVRRGGIGKRLLGEMIEACTALGFRQLIGIIGDSQNHQSIRFHEQMGFRHVGRIENIGFKFGRWMDQVLMQRALGEGSDTPPAA